jgi:4-hydroxybenzoate polyprenyltransferase
MRPHFFFIPAGAALSGAAAHGGFEHPVRVAVVVAAAGVGWGVGQLLNDVLDVEADRVDAPSRPAARGLLPAGPTLSVALLLGMLVSVAVGIAAPTGIALIPIAALLLVGYNAAKRLPVAGNIAHGALIAAAAGFGYLATPASVAVPVVWPTLGYVAAVAALYLQANYEKDRRGDQRAGYRTLAHVLGVRGSAVVRALLSVALVWVAAPSLLRHDLALVLAAVGCALVVASASLPLWLGTEAGSLRTYPLAMHGAAAMLLAPVASASAPLAGIALSISVVLTERARRRHPNP